jgi:hypothetical protein
VDLKLPLPRKAPPDLRHRTAPDAEASALRLDVELGELVGSRARGRWASNKCESGSLAVRLDDECVTAWLGPVRVEVWVAGRIGRTDGHIAMAAEFAKVTVEERFDETRIRCASGLEFNRCIRMVHHAA